MTPYYTALIAGFVAITLIDTVGAIASRKLKFSYVYLGIISALIYILLALYVCRYGDVRNAFMVNALLGIYDATVGFWLSLALKANFPQKEEVNIEPGLGSAVVMVIVSSIFTLIGYGLSHI